MMWLKRLIYRLGFRPSWGPLYSPSMNLRYATQGLYKFPERLKWWQVKQRNACPHSDLRPIYGDEIHQAGGKRLQCRRCGRLLDGPLVLSVMRTISEKRF